MSRRKTLGRLTADERAELTERAQELYAEGKNLGEIHDVMVKEWPDSSPYQIGVLLELFEPQSNGYLPKSANRRPPWNPATDPKPRFLGRRA